MYVLEGNVSSPANSPAPEFKEILISVASARGIKLNEKLPSKLTKLEIVAPVTFKSLSIKPVTTTGTSNCKNLKFTEILESSVILGAVNSATIPISPLLLLKILPTSSSLRATEYIRASSMKPAKRSLNEGIPPKNQSPKEISPCLPIGKEFSEANCPFKYCFIRPVSRSTTMTTWYQLFTSIELEESPL